MEEKSAVLKLSVLAMIADVQSKDKKEPINQANLHRCFRRMIRPRRVAKFAVLANTEKGKKLFRDAYKLAPSILRAEHMDSESSFVQLSYPFLFTQQSWACRYLVNLWKRRHSVSVLHLNPTESQNLQLAVSWHSRLDVFEWSIWMDWVNV